ncbi:MAG: TetR/AcrR family transcriptional regulator [Chthoniobacterales bacterium]
MKSNRLVTKKRTSAKQKKISGGRRPSGETRRELLAVALEMFSQHGFEGVSVDELVQRAHTTKRMVYHYFGSKLGLYREALEEVYRKLTEVEVDIFREEPPMSVAIEELLRAYFYFLQENTDLIRILLWENLQGGKNLPSIDKKITKAPVLEALERAIRRGQKQGEIRRDIDSQHLLIHLIGLCLVYFSNRHTLSLSVGVDLHEEANLEKGIEQAIRLAQHGFLKSK